MLSNLVISYTKHPTKVEWVKDLEHNTKDLRKAGHFNEDEVREILKSKGFYSMYYKTHRIEDLEHLTELTVPALSLDKMEKVHGCK